MYINKITTAKTSFQFHSIPIWPISHEKNIFLGQIFLDHSSSSNHDIKQYFYRVDIKLYRLLFSKCPAQFYRNLFIWSRFNGGCYNPTTNIRDPLLSTQYPCNHSDQYFFPITGNTRQCREWTDLCFWRWRRRVAVAAAAEAALPWELRSARCGARWCRRLRTQKCASLV